MRSKNNCANRGEPLDEEWDRERKELFDREQRRRHEIYREVNV